MQVPQLTSRSLSPRASTPSIPLTLLRTCTPHQQPGYHVLTSTALQSKGVNALVFALYRELSASVLIAGLASIAVHRGGHSWMIEMRHLPRFVAMVREFLHNWWEYLGVGLFANGSCLCAHTNPEPTHANAQLSTT